MTDLDKRFDDLDLRVNGHILSTVQKSEQDIRQLLEKANEREVSVLQVNERLS